MKKILVLTAAFAFVLAIPMTVLAAGYGAAGCGLGNLAFGAKPGGQQILAATTNGTFGSQTFGITSGTSNCGDHGLLNLSKEREIFAEQNYSSLVKEMAMGEGENLVTLASLYGCQANSHPEFGALVQDKFDTLIENDQTTSNEMLFKLQEELMYHPKLSKACHVVLQ